jgi:hypothetical protein
VLPSNRGDVGEQRIWYDLAATSQCVQGAAEIDGVPQHDCGSFERQATGAVLLQFSRAISQTAEAVEAQLCVRARRRSCGVHHTPPSPVS